MAEVDKPNILIIWGDDIGYWNISRYSMGMMGYQTPQHRPHRGGKGRPSPIGTASRAARLGARASSPVRTQSAPG